MKHLSRWYIYACTSLMSYVQCKLLAMILVCKTDGDDYDSANFFPKLVTLTLKTLSLFCRDVQDVEVTDKVFNLYDMQSSRLNQYCVRRFCKKSFLNLQQTTFWMAIFFQILSLKLFADQVILLIILK